MTSFPRPKCLRCLVAIALTAGIVGLMFTMHNSQSGRRLTREKTKQETEAEIVQKLRLLSLTNQSKPVHPQTTNHIASSTLDVETVPKFLYAAVQNDTELALHNANGLTVHFPEGKKRQSEFPNKRADANQGSDAEVPRSPPQTTRSSPSAQSPLIPHILHQTWDSEMVPEYFADWIKSWIRLGLYDINCNS